MADSERRSSVRYEPERVTLLIGWTDSTGFASAQSEVLNISLGGVALSVARVPSGLHSAWIRLIGDDSGHAEWVRVSVLEIRDVAGSEQRIRLKFDGFCPYEFFKTITFTTRAIDDDTPSSRRPDVEPLPSPRLASLSRAATQQHDISPERQQPEPARPAKSPPCLGATSGLPSPHGGAVGQTTTKVHSVFRGRNFDRLKYFIIK